MKKSNGNGKKSNSTKNKTQSLKAIDIVEYKLSNGMKITGPPNVFVYGLFMENFKMQSYIINENFQIGPNYTVIDIGANVGIFSMFAAMASPSAKIYCFEPSGDNFRHLKKNISRNGFKKIHPYQWAVTDGKTKEVTLYHHEAGAMHSIHTQRFTTTQPEGSETVKAYSLNEVFEKLKIKQCDFLKLDCEGAEYDIFEGTSDETFSKIKRISMEYHPVGEKNGATLKKLLESKGFGVYVGEPDRHGFGRLVALPVENRERVTSNEHSETTMS